MRACSGCVSIISPRNYTRAAALQCIGCVPRSGAAQPGAIRSNWIYSLAAWMEWAVIIAVMFHVGCVSSVLCGPATARGAEAERVPQLAPACAHGAVLFLAVARPASPPLLF